MAEFLKVVNYQTALQKISAYFPPVQTEEIDLSDSLNRVLAEELISPENSPAFARSTVDGYAVNAADTFGSSDSLPAYLSFIGKTKIGFEPELHIAQSQCAWISTGGMLPKGSNAAVMLEYTEKLGDDTILIYRPVSPGENVMQKGEDITVGEKIFSAGKLLRPQDIGFLASLGISTLKIRKPYKIGVISTGDEIIPIQAVPQMGQVRDINSYSLAAAISSCGNIPTTYPLVKDEFAAIKKLVAEALSFNDVVIISGGSSVGLTDLTLEVLLSFADSQMLFHGIAVKPGKPTMAVRVGSQLVIGLPGHPVSALMMFHLVCKKAMSVDDQVAVEARLAVNIASEAGRDDFIPVQLIYENNQCIAQPLLGKSGLMSLLSFADAYMHIPCKKQGLKKGEKIKAYIF